ncbi:MAG: hypothetical protein KIS73_27010 [Enhydrobacter sp.]|nr:hypothetical protein [Enhydrobacter sp.]
MSFNVISFLKSALANVGAVPVADNNPLPVQMMASGGGSISSVHYETVAASQSDQIMGATGAVGDYLAGVLIIPTTLSPGAVSIKDGNGSGITIFAGGVGSITTLHPFFVPIGARCVAATTPGWKITTGANMSAIGLGSFT